MEMISHKAKCLVQVSTYCFLHLNRSTYQSKSAAKISQRKFQALKKLRVHISLSSIPKIYQSIKISRMNRQDLPDSLFPNIEIHFLPNLTSKHLYEQFHQTLCVAGIFVLRHVIQLLATRRTSLDDPYRSQHPGYDPNP